MFNTLLSYFFKKDSLKMLSRPTIKESELISETISNFRSTLPINTENLTGAAYEWATNMNRLRTLVFEDDLRRFLQWDVIKQTMFVDNSKFVKHELKSLKKSAKFKDYWKPNIIESKVGLPNNYKYYKLSSGNLIHHAYHVQQFEEKANISICDVDFIFEFGGGYGSMCRLIKNLGYNKKYVIFDLPLFSLIQTYFLKSLGHKILSVEEFNNSKDGILCISDFDELQKILNNLNTINKNLFIATWSISETPLDIRNKFTAIDENFNLYLIAFQDKFGDVNNLEYFKNFKENKSNLTWFDWKMKFIKGSNYLIGKK